MSDVNRKRVRAAELQRNLEDVYKNGFHRGVIKSEKVGRFIGVYYVTPKGEYLRNITDVINWLDMNSTETKLLSSNFNFIPKKLTESCQQEFVIDQKEIPPELVEYVLETKKSKAPEITIIDNVLNIQSDVFINIVNPISEPEHEIDQKRIKLEDPVSEVKEIISPIISLKPEIPTNDLMLMPHVPFQNPSVVVNHQNILESTQICHLNRLSQFVKNDFQEISKDFRSFCSTDCSFDLRGNPRMAFECDICLILWHTDCIGYRWLTIKTIKLIICDNCYLLSKSIEISVPNIFCNMEALFQQESKLENMKTASQPWKYNQILKLCKIQWILTKASTEFSKSKASSKQTKHDSPLAPLPAVRRWKHIYEMIITPNNVIRELKEEFVRLQYSIKSVDILSKIFSDSECQLSIDELVFQVSSSRIILKNGEMIIPINGRILKPSKGVFFTTDHNQELNMKYLARCEEMKKAMINSFYSRFSAPVTDNKVTITLADNGNKVIPMTTVLNPLTTNPNRFKIISSQILVSKPLGVPISTPSMTKKLQPTTPQTVIKLRQRKQDFSTQTAQLRLCSYMRNKQFTLLNLPFLILERILSSPVLSTQDKLNCRLTSRVLKCVIDGAQVVRCVANKI